MVTNRSVGPGTLVVLVPWRVTRYDASFTRGRRRILASRISGPQWPAVPPRQPRR